MPTLAGLLKPCYVFAPRTAMRRIGMSLFPFERSVARVELPWGGVLEVNPCEGIGRELMRQNIFDIAVSETAWRLLRPGDVAVDVGANIGYMSSLFAARVGPQGRVEAFEPHPRIFARLSHNLTGARTIGTQRAASRIALHQCALGNRDGTAYLVEPRSFRMNEGASTMASADGGVGDDAAPAGFEVPMARFDSVFGDREIALLKVDVEGFEAQVLQGAEYALAQQRIRNLIYEAHDCERSEVHALLSGHGYAVFGIGHDLFGPCVRRGTAAPGVDRRWESPSYLATLEPAEVVAALTPRGWRALKAG